jgi:prepilin-type N-terminal cleavage/methylation domain-containing protein
MIQRRHNTEGLSDAQRRRRRCFSLVEIVAVLLIVGILAGAGMMGTAAFFNGFVSGRANAELTQKAQNAMQRLIMELRFLDVDETTGAPLLVVSGTPATLTFTSKRDLTSPRPSHVVNVVGTELRLDTRPLTDRVTSFVASYNSGTGEVRLVLGMERIGTLEASVFP